jgi:Icc-related predicted phosphoesterase
MIFGALGDIHGDFASVHAILEAEPDVPFWLAVGDLADEHGRYEPAPSPIYWIKGNNENFDAIAGGELPPNLHYLANGTLTTIQGVRVCALGGTFAPSVYETPASALPHPRKGTPKATALADRRRHFVREEVEACRRLADVDLLLTHEAPRPYFIGRVDAGKTPINEVLADARPRLHLFGHHHRLTEQTTRQGVTSVGLDVVARSYLLIRAETMEYDVRLR